MSSSVVVHTRLLNWCDQAVSKKLMRLADVVITCSLSLLREPFSLQKLRLIHHTRLAQLPDRTNLAAFVSETGPDAVHVEQLDKEVLATH